MTGWEVLARAAQPEAERLRAALRSPRAQQLAWLRECLARNASSEFGRRHGFDGVRTIDDYRRAVPIQRFEDVEPWVNRIAAGETAILTGDEVVAFESTGGSAGGRKFVPYTVLSLAAFRAALLPWLGCLLSERPAIRSGRAYVAASPAMREPEPQRRGRSVGLASEADYLGPDLSRALCDVLVAPLCATPDFEAWRDETLLALLCAPDLTMISVWSPTFLLRLLDGIDERREQLLCMLKRRSEHAVAERLEGRAAARQQDLRDLWPQLDTISMWTDAASAEYADQVRRRFPGVHVDRKALLATETPMTVRLDQSREGAVPALTSAFLEFLRRDGSECIADELREGEVYRVVVTTPGGLYRYDIGDEVLCCAVDGVIPDLRFIGRAGVVSDLVGEKLTESFVSSVLGGLGTPVAIAPQRTDSPFYEIWVDGNEFDPGGLEERIDRLLGRNPQYAYARKLGQLGAPRAVFCAGVHEYRRAALVARGARWGDVKPTALVIDRSTLPSVQGRTTT